MNRLTIALVSIGVAAAVPACAMDAMDAAAKFRDEMNTGEAVAQAADAAFFCRFRSGPWMMKADDAVKAGFRRAFQKWEAASDDKAKFEGLAGMIQIEADRDYTAWRQMAMQGGVSTSDCLDLHSSGIMERLDGLVGVAH